MKPRDLIPPSFPDTAASGQVGTSGCFRIAIHFYRWRTFLKETGAQSTGAGILVQADSLKKLVGGHAKLRIKLVYHDHAGEQCQNAHRFRHLLAVIEPNTVIFPIGARGKASHLVLKQTVENGSTGRMPFAVAHRLLLEDGSALFRAGT